jgi:hypothetical protein
MLLLEQQAWLRYGANLLLHYLIHPLLQWQLFIHSCDTCGTSSSEQRQPIPTRR